MKTLKLFGKSFFGLILILLFMNSCEQEKEVNLAEDEELRNDVYEQILSNEALFTEFMEEMRASDKPMEWMSRHKPMMRNMYGRNQMQRMMRNNPGTMDSLMQNMMVMMEQDSSMIRRNPQMRQKIMRHMMMIMQRDTAAYNQMQQMMKQKGNMNSNMR